MARKLDRREFLITTAVVGGGMALSLHYPDAAAQPSAFKRINARPWLPPAEGGTEMDPWIVIAPDDRVLIRINQSELGQGVMTSNPMMICEELECDWSKVQAVYSDPNSALRAKRPYNRLRTGASSSVRLGRKDYQQAGASARERLKASAAQIWNVPVAEIEAKNSVLTHKPTGRTLRYGEVAEKAASIKLDAEPPIKTPEQYRLIGRRVPRFDVEAKARAEAVYGIDVRLPGMVYAAIKQVPAYGGALKSFDFEAVRNMPGVIAAAPIDGVGMYNGVAVVADTWWRAKTALDRMPVVWEAGPNAGGGTGEMLVEFRAALDKAGPTPVDKGDVEAALRAAGKIVEAEYQLSHQAHAPMEPPNCTAHVTAERAELWFGTQAPDVATRVTAQLTGLKPEQVYVRNCFSGGGFGKGGLHGEFQQAVIVAKALNGRPVKLLWSREQDIAHDNGFHPMGLTRMKAALGADGMPSALWVKISGNDEAQGAPLIEYGPHKAKVAHQLLRGFHRVPYAAPNLRVEVNTMKTFVPPGAWRSTGSYANVFYMESFIDELAHAAGRDPLDYRRALVRAASPDDFEDNAQADWLMALDTLAEKSGWGRSLPKGTGMGMAIDDRKSVDPRGIALVALAMTVSVSKAGVVGIERMDVVHDSGHALINPEAAERQIRGMTAWSLGPALRQEITFKNGAAEQSNFDSYVPVGMSDFPREINLHFIKTKRWISGIGEEVVPLVAPALCNAIFAATGKRIRSVPLNKHDLSWA
jgi:isoquinoline 1-oxidoreductase beta subunit